MSIAEKLSNAKPTSLITEGMSDEEAKKIVENARSAKENNCTNCANMIRTGGMVTCGVTNRIIGSTWKAQVKCCENHRRL